jgi:NAD+ kinase
MKAHFKNIALMGRQHRDGVSDTLQTLIDFLQQRELNVVVETNSASMLDDANIPTVDYAELGKDQDLVIVIGGDGSLLKAAKSAAKFNTPVLGVNRGTLGFLTDINPDDVIAQVSNVLQGHYLEEKRFFVNAKLHTNGETVSEGLALNDVVLLPGKDAAKMIEFDVYVNKEFVCHQRSDGLIVATPTGSTAYALSAGGPILSPGLDALVLVPMFPHTLSLRPLVVNANDRIKITIANEMLTNPRISCDGDPPIALPPGGHIHIDKSSLSLRLIHPADYNYFHTLRSKLRWGEKLC